MKRMFASATVKLTAYYLTILVAISLLFSFIIFEIATSEISERLERLQLRIEGSNRTVTLPGPVTLRDVRINQTNEARASLLVGLAYTNIAVVVIGGAGSFLLARRTLRPIEQAHEAQSRFTSDASHELRTPLAVMQSEIQVALRDPTTSKKELIELLKSNLEEVQTLTQLSTSLLELSKIDHTHVERTDRVDLLQEVYMIAESFIRDGATISIDSHASNTIMTANKSLICDAIRIVTDNAIKYSASRTASVDVHSNGRNITLIITNDGKGITERDLEHVFEPFYRSSKSQDVDGHGLGLPLARKIITLHDGIITLNSTEKMTVCTIVLPHFQRNR